MKILILSSRFPYPLDKGDKLRLYHQIRILSQHHEIILVSLHENPISEDALSALKEYCSKVFTFHLSKSKIWWNVLKGLISGKPAQVSYFYQNKIQEQINKIFEDEKPDHIYCQLIRMVEYSKSFDIPKTLDYMDCFYLSTVKRAQHSNALMQQLWNLESMLVKKYETSVYPKFKHHTIISNIDLVAMGLGKKPVTIVPNGLNEVYYFEIDPKPTRDIDILFLGNLAYFSNIAAVRFLLEEIIPKLDKTKTRKIVIAGAQPTESVKKWIQAYPQVELIENPTDTRSIYQRAKLFVAPIFAGTGQQNKILEAIASGCIVICTPVVQTALRIDTPQMIHVQQNAQGFAKEIDLILLHPEQFHPQNLQAKEYIRRHFSWEKNTSILEKLITGSGGKG